MLATALAAAGERLERVEIAQARYRPGRSVTVSYRARLGRGRALLVAHAGAGMPDGAVLLEDGALRVGVWRYPNDPRLPGLPDAVDGERLPRLLGRLGVGATVAGVRRRAYRPGRRAVVEVTTAEGRLFLKVVRPARAAALWERHDAIAARLEAPRVIAADAGLGILVLSPVPGTPLRGALSAGRSRPVPPAAALAAVLDRLPPLPHPATGPRDRAAGHAALLAAVVPDLAGRVEELAAQLAPAGPADGVPVHGDFHPGQVMLRDGEVAGLVDVDAAGYGSRVDDLATMLGYLAAASAGAEPSGPAAAYGAELHAGFAAVTDPAELARRVAAAVLGFATMPFVTQQPSWPDRVRWRVECAEAWLASGGGGPV